MCRMFNLQKTAKIKLNVNNIDNKKTNNKRKAEIFNYVQL